MLDVEKDDRVVSTTHLHEVPLSYNKKVRKGNKIDDRFSFTTEIILGAEKKTNSVCVYNFYIVFKLFRSNFLYYFAWQQNSQEQTVYRLTTIRRKAFRRRCIPLTYTIVLGTAHHLGFHNTTSRKLDLFSLKVKEVLETLSNGPAS
jgi:hypothetical protein